MGALTVFYCRDKALFLSSTSSCRFYMRTNDYGSTTDGDTVFVDTGTISSTKAYMASGTVATSQKYAANYWEDSSTLGLSSALTWTSASSLSDAEDTVSVSAYNGVISVSLSGWKTASSGTTIYPSFRVTFTANGSTIMQDYEYSQMVSGISKSLTTDTNYTVKVTIYETSTQIKNVTVYNGSPPTISGWSISDVEKTSMKVFWSQTGSSNMYLYYGTSPYMFFSIPVTPSSGSYTLTGLTEGATYYLYLYATNDYGDYETGTKTATTNARPSDFYWTNTHGSGYACTTLTHTEWNNLCDAVNEFRTYEDLSTINFTSATSGGTFTHGMFNQVRNAIYAILVAASVSTSGFPSTVSSGDTVYWSNIDALRTYLNSVP